MTGIFLVSHLLLWLIVLGEGLVILALARQIGVMQKRLVPSGARMTNDGLELGNEAPRFEERDLNEHTVTLGVERSMPTLLIFISPGCSVCEEIAPAIRTLYRKEKQIEILVISFLGEIPENRAYAKLYKLEKTHYVVAPHLAELYQVSSSPYAIIVDREGKVHTKGLVNSAEHLESLLNALDEGYATLDLKRNAASTPVSQATLKEG